MIRFQTVIASFNVTTGASFNLQNNSMSLNIHCHLLDVKYSSHPPPLTCSHSTLRFFINTLYLCHGFRYFSSIIIFINYPENNLIPTLKNRVPFPEPYFEKLAHPMTQGSVATQDFCYRYQSFNIHTYSPVNLSASYC